MEYDEKVLPSVGNEIMKAVVVSSKFQCAFSLAAWFQRKLVAHLVTIFQAKYDAAELITQRENVSQQIRERLSKRAKSFGILVEDVAIVSFKPTFVFS